MTAAVPREAARLSEPQRAAWRGLMRGHAALLKTLDAELDAAHGLPLTSFEVLLALDAAPAQRMRMCDLASSVLLSRSGISRLVDRLERDGLVARGSCEADARGAFAVLTDAGADRLLAARETHIEGVRRHFLAHFEAAELGVLAELLGRLRGEPASEPGPHGG